MKLKSRFVGSKSNLEKRTVRNNVSEKKQHKQAAKRYTFYLRSLTPVFDSNDILRSLTEIHQFIYLHYKKKKEKKEGKRKRYKFGICVEKISDVF